MKMFRKKHIEKYIEVKYQEGKLVFNKNTINPKSNN